MNIFNKRGIKKCSEVTILYELHKLCEKVHYEFSFKKQKFFVLGFSELTDDEKNKIPIQHDNSINHKIAIIK